MATRRSALGAGISRAGEAIAEGLNRRYDRQVQEQERREDKRRFDLQFALTEEKVESQMMTEELNRAIQILGPDNTQASVTDVLQLAPRLETKLQGLGIDTTRLANIPWNSQGLASLMDQRSREIFNSLPDGKAEMMINLLNEGVAATFEERMNMSQLDQAAQIQLQLLNLEALQGMSPEDIRAAQYGLASEGIEVDGVTYRRFDDIINLYKHRYQSQLNGLRSLNGAATGGVGLTREDFERYAESNMEEFKRATSPTGNPQDGYNPPDLQTAIDLEEQLSTGNYAEFFDRMIEDATRQSRETGNIDYIRKLRYGAYLLNQQAYAAGFESSSQLANYLIQNLDDDAVAGNAEAVAQLVQILSRPDALQMVAQNPGTFGNLTGGVPTIDFITENDTKIPVAPAQFIYGIPRTDEQGEVVRNEEGLPEYVLEPLIERSEEMSYSDLNQNEKIMATAWGWRSLMMGTQTTAMLNAALPGLGDQIAVIDPNARLINELVVASNDGRLARDPVLAAMYGQTPYELIDLGEGGIPIAPDVATSIRSLASGQAAKLPIGSVEEGEGGTEGESGVGFGPEFNTVDLNRDTRLPTRADIMAKFNRFLNGEAAAQNQITDDPSVPPSTPEPVVRTEPDPLNPVSPVEEEEPEASSQTQPEFNQPEFLPQTQAEFNQPEPIPEAPGPLEEPPAPDLDTKRISSIESTSPEEIATAVESSGLPENLVTENARTMGIVQDPQIPEPEKRRALSDSVANVFAVGQNEIQGRVAQALLEPIARPDPMTGEVSTTAPFYYNEEVLGYLGISDPSPEVMGALTQTASELPTRLRQLEEVAQSGDLQSFSNMQAQIGEEISATVSLLTQEATPPPAEERMDAPVEVEDPREYPLAFAAPDQTPEEAYQALEDRIYDSYGRGQPASRREARVAVHFADALSVINYMEPQLADAIASLAQEVDVNRGWEFINPLNRVVRDVLGVQNRDTRGFRNAFRDYVSPAATKRAKSWHPPASFRYRTKMIEELEKLLEEAQNGDS